MGGAEFLQTVAKFIDNLVGGADDHSEEATLEETLAREGQTVLLVQQLFAEVHVVCNIAELFKVNAHHHVHGSAASNRSYTANGGQFRKGSLRGGSQFHFHVFEVTVGHLFEYLR